MWPVKNPATGVHDPALRAEDVSEDETYDHPGGDDRDVNGGPPQHPAGQPIREERRREQADGHLGRDRDDDVEERVERGRADDGVVEDLGEIGEADERVGGARENVPVEKADLELAEDRVNGEDQRT